MPCTVIRRDPQCLWTSADHVAGHDVLFVDPVLERTADAAGNIFRRLEGPDRSDRDLVVFRYGTTAQRALLESDPVLKEVTRGSIVAFLGPRDGAMSLNLASWSSSGPVPPLDDLGDAEIQSILHRCEAVYDGNGDHHFILPSGRHAERFVRLGDALRDEVEVQRIADWVLPAIGEADCIVGDSGSILPLLLELKYRSLAQHNRMLRIATLDSYPETPTAVAAVLRDLRAGDQAIAFILSVNSTGTFLRAFERLARPRERIVTVVDGSSQEPPDELSHSLSTLARLPLGLLEMGLEDSCSLCEGSPTILIHPRTYERLPHVERKVVRLDIGAAATLREFWEAVDRQRAIALHRDAPYTLAGRRAQRHLPIWLDMTSLLRDSWFRSECISHLRQLRPPSIVLIPAHSASPVLSEMVDEVFPDATALSIGPGKFTNDVSDQVRRAERILIFDDALVSGRTLTGLRDEIFRHTQAAGSNPMVTALVLVARPGAGTALRAVRRRYTSEHGMGFGCVFLVPLPTSHDDCPWCAEREILKTALGQLSDEGRSTAGARLELLRGDRLGGPFVLGGAAGGIRSTAMTEGSFLGRLSAPTAFAASASAALTQLREAMTGELLDGIVNFDLELFLEAYYESTIVSGVLRTLPISALRWPVRDGRVADQLRRLDRLRTYPGTLEEVAWAAVWRKVPATPVKRLIDECVDPSPDLAMIRELLEQRAGE